MDGNEMKIRILGQNIINQNAAGEVNERPASAIKELVENSIDAGATRIDVVVRDAGKSYISVADNGCGMGKADLEKSILRHATSKLSSDDLLDINFLGFRGEALPSIASVAKMTVTTNDGAECWRLRIEGGEAKGLSPAALPPGTRVEVENLFFNVPARLSFLKSERSEMSAAIDTVERIAMCYPAVEFRLNDTIKFRAGSRISRVADVMGREFGENAIEVGASLHGLSISGYISRPTYTKGTSASQYFYVNGRAVKDKLLLGSLRAAYQDVIERGRFPAAVLWLSIPIRDIDVNVHPQKAEVRFKEQSLVRGSIISVLRMRLRDAEVAPNIIDISRAVGGYGQSRPAQYGVAEQAGFSGGFFQPGVNPASVGGAADEEEASKYPLGVARGQLFNTYIVSQTADGMVILDQHACHERIVYENLKREMEAGGAKRQILLIPEIVELGEAKASSLLAGADELAQFGLVLEEFGKGAVIVREAPAALGACDLQGLVKDIAEDIEDMNRAHILSDRLSMIAKTFSCHTSIRAGRALTISEMNELLRQVEATENAGQCNHGRRSYVKLALKELGKLFDR
ncbi:MAG: DNA mismatch repair endonuclease MutL [Rickettsiales bacterium]|jgi:DNA mismatch repair protein MutL|nr:DNA mismatch repair endonuclease MutL [Rickettsiales bacterium]